MASNSGYQQGTNAAPIGKKVYYNYGAQAPGPSNSVPAGVTTNLGTANSNLTYTSQDPENALTGNDITVTYVVAGNSTPLSVSVNGKAITVNVATDSGGAATSTGSQVLAAVNGNTAAHALVAASLAPSNSGAGVVSAGTWRTVGAIAKHPVSGSQPLPRQHPIHNTYA